MRVVDITAEKPAEEKILRLAAYCRVSSDSEDQLHSFAAQIQYYKDYERNHPQYRLVDIYADEGITGTCMDKRDELNRLIRDCKKGLVDRVIVKSVSRFARNTAELLTVIRLLKDIGVSVFFEEQGIDTNKLNSELIMTFPGMVAQKESESISGNLRWSIRNRMRTGEYVASSSPYGFRLIGNELTIHEEEAAVVRRIFSLYLQGFGKQAIANILNAENVPRRPGQEKWYNRTIHYILNNERYYGDTLLQKTYATDAFPFRMVKNHGEKEQFYVEKTNPVIIDRDVFDAAKKFQQVRQRNTNCPLNVYPLTGTLRCPDCGTPFRRIVLREKVYWICNSRTNKRSACVSRRVKECGVYDAFTYMVSKLTENRHELIGNLIHHVEVMQERTGEGHKRIRAIDKEIADLAAQNLVLVRLHTNGILDGADYAAQSADISGKITALRTERKKKLSENEADAQLDRLKELFALLDDYQPTYQFDEDLYRQIVDRVTVINNTALRFHLIGGIVLTEKIRKKWRCKQT